MRKITLTTCLVSALAGLAFAGPVAMEKNIAPAPPPCDWTGFYVGANANLATFQPKFTDLDYFEGYDTRTFDSTSFIGGGQVGYNWQWQNLVLGAELDFDGSTGDVSTHTTFGRSFSSQTDAASIDFIGTARARMGVAPVQNVLIYVTGGGAYAHGDWHEHYGQLSGTEADDWNGNDWRWGWVGGMGIEYMLNCHWTLRAEALYYNLQEDTVNAVPSGGASSSDRAFRYRFEDDLWSVGVGVNYKFTGFFGH